MTAVKTYPDLEQGSDEWLEARRGIVTASVVGQLITPTLKVAANDTSRGLTAQLVAERITGWIEPVFVSDDMWRGRMDEPLARNLYAETRGTAVTELGFMTLDLDGAVLGYSPDGLVRDDGLIEVKSRKPKIHLTHIFSPTLTHGHMAQVQAGLLVSGREWCDFISWCGGMPMHVTRVYPDPEWADVIVRAVKEFEANATLAAHNYAALVEGLPTTERTEYFPEARV